MTEKLKGISPAGKLKGMKIPKRQKHESGPFSVRSAFLITLVFTAFLWWLPVFGQIIAGYLGGRKSGSVVKGIAVTLGAVMLFILVSLILNTMGLDMVDAQNTMITAVLGGFPELAGFVSGLFAYMQSMFSSFGTFGAANAVICIITVAFGAVGGMMSMQAVKESGNRIGSTASAGSVRSLDAYRNGRGMGFGSFSDYDPVTAVQAGRSSEPASVQKKPVQTEQPVYVQEKKESPFASILSMSDRTPEPVASAQSYDAAPAPSVTPSQPKPAKEEYDYI